MISLPVDLAPYLEAELLHPGLGEEQIRHGCMQAERYHFVAVCVQPHWVKAVKEWLYQCPVIVATVIGFPLGLSCSATKLYEAQLAVEQGARELDVVVNPVWVRSQAWDPLFAELASMQEATQVGIKAVLEMDLLTPEQVAGAVDVCLQAGVSHLKGSTGWGGPAAVSHVRQLAQLSRGRAGIKASGHIKTAADVEAFLIAGATRIGTTRGVEILAEWGSR
jgi:deoxyribose-phosphate aldolase